MYEIESANSMAFHPQFFDQPVRNSSAGYDYELWNKTGRQEAAKQVKKETREQPQATEELELSPDVRVVSPPGGVLIFSAAQLHSTVPNTTARARFSIDFRTVNLDDLIEGVGAANRDSDCTGTTLGDYLRASDLEPLPEDLIAIYAERRRASAGHELTAIPGDGGFEASSSPSSPRQPNTGRSRRRRPRPAARRPQAGQLADQRLP